MIINSYRYVDSGLDADATAFINAGSFSSAEQTAIRNLVDNLKGNGSTPNSSDLWSEIPSGGEVYPMAFKTSSNNSLGLSRNGKDLTFVNSPTHESTGGVTFNGTTQYARTNITPSSDLVINDSTLSVYLTDNSQQSKIALGAWSNSAANRISYNPRTTSDTASANAYDNTALTVSNDDSSGLQSFTIRGAADKEYYRNGESIGTNTATSSGSLPSNEIYIGAVSRDGGVASFYYANTYRFAAIMNGLSDQQVEDLNYCVSAFLAEIDAANFIDAMTSPTSTEETAVQNLTKSLYGIGTTNESHLITKIPSGSDLWPMSFSSSANNALGIKRNQDLTFVNSPTHSDGVTFNGTSQYAQTGVVPSTDLTENDVTLFSYETTNKAEDSASIGSFDGTNRLTLLPRVVNNNYFEIRIHDLASRIRHTDTDSSGLSLGTRRSITDLELYRNGISEATSSTSDTGALSTVELYIAARNNSGTADIYKNNTLRFCGAVDGLTDNEVSDLTECYYKMAIDLFGLDSDAENYINAGTFSYKEQYGINEFFKDLKGTGNTTNNTDIFSEIENGEIWLSCWSDATNNSLGVARNSDLTFVNSPTHSDGVTYSGISQYFKTGITPSTDLNLNNVTLFADIQSHNSPASAKTALGCFTVASTHNFRLLPNSANVMYYDCLDNSSGRISGAQSLTKGLAVGSRRASNDVEIYYEGSTVASGTSSGGSLPSIELYGACDNANGTPSRFFYGKIRMTGVVNGLTDNQVQDLKDARDNLYNFLNI